MSSSRTVNQAEMEMFSRMADDFWNLEGVYKPLHAMNSVRVELLSESLAATGLTLPVTTRSKKPLAGVKILDVGCGAGLFSEALARKGRAIYSSHVLQEGNVGIGQV